MLDIIRSNKQVIYPNPTSKPNYEVRQFMRNFIEAVHQGDQKEISTYYADGTEPLSVPKCAEWKDESFFAEDDLATLSYSLGMDAGAPLRLTFVLEKSEGYWQIILGKANADGRSH